MRRAAGFLALLLCLYWTGAQGESGGLTENDAETLGVKADIWAELKELRDMVIIHSVELRQMEQENTDLKARMNASDKKVEELERENTDLKCRLNISEKVVEELKTENAAIQDRLTDNEIKSAVLEARMDASDNKVEELERENIVLEARMNAGEIVVEELKSENAVLEARMNAGEIVVEELERLITVLEARMSSTENEVEELKGGTAERTKVAFTANLSGRFGPYSSETRLKFSKVTTNIGQGYDPDTGAFRAPVKGTYYFRFRGYENTEGRPIEVNIHHNGNIVTVARDKVPKGGLADASTGIVLQLEQGDEIYLALRIYCSIYGNVENQSSFSGFLIFAE